jgi:hypothetical protein
LYDWPIVVAGLVTGNFCTSESSNNTVGGALIFGHQVGVLAQSEANVVVSESFV